MDPVESPRLLTLRVKSKKTQNGILRDISPTETVSELLSKLSGLTGIPEDQMALLKGFPPKRMEYEPDQPVSSLGFELQDAVIVEHDLNASKKAESAVRVTSKEQKTPEEKEINVDRKKSYSDSASASASSSIDKADSLDQDKEEDETEGEGHLGVLMRYVVPSDNSCLFSSISFCVHGDQASEIGAVEISSVQLYRQLVASIVLSDDVTYNDAVLGRPTNEYATWIQKDESWGGGIELSILTEQTGLEIDVVDIQSKNISRFGEDKGFTSRMFLIYDGIHYDPLYMECFDGGKIRTLFDSNDRSVLRKALELGTEAHAAHQYTDLKNFSLRCRDCNTLLKGQEEAQLHARGTRHTRFAEVN